MSCVNRCKTSAGIREYSLKVTIQRVKAAAATDGHGFVDKTAAASWETYTTAWAKCTSKGGREWWKVDRQEATVTHVWHCPYDTTLVAADSAMRLVYGSETHNIETVDNIDRMDTEIEIRTSIQT